MPNGPPAAAIWLLKLGAWLAPQHARAEWETCWNLRLFNLWILAERGELGLRARPETIALMRAAWSQAFWLRYTRAELRRWLRGPWMPVATAGALATGLAILSRGYTATCEVVSATIEWQIDPPIIGHDPRGNMVMGHLIPIAMAFTIGAALLLIGKHSLGRFGWRYWLFFAFKALAMMTLIPLAWTEAYPAITHQISHELLRAWIAGMGSTLVFLAVFGISVIWILSDQRVRCPVCLRRLARPVTFGSWASMIEPVTTEFLCDEGHGSLSLGESEAGARNRWVVLDASWRGL